MSIKVKIFLPDSEIVLGTISYTTEGPKLHDGNKNPIKQDTKLVEFSIIDDTYLKSAAINSSDRVKFDSLTFYQKMDRKNQTKNDYYPPSTEGWILSLSQNGPLARIDIHEVNDGKRLLISCIDMKSEKVLIFHTIRPFEKNILILETDWEYYNRVFAVSDEDEVSLEKLLEAPAPSWDAIKLLVKGVRKLDLQRYGTTGETLSQLIPLSFPEDVRKELMVFLAWTLRATIPKEDPLDFLNSIYRRFRSGPRLINLVFGHMQCLIQDTPVPEYVRIFTMAEQGTLHMGVKTQTEDVEQESWNQAWYRINELFPNRYDRIIELTNHLNQSQEIHTNLPVTKVQASASKDAWLDRFALIKSNFMMRGYIQDRKIGLQKMVYIGGAHRWPHKHLQLTIRLGHPNQKPPYLQIIVMPKTAVERISRVRQNIIPIDWTASRVNFNLYNVDNDTWKYNSAHFIKSFDKQKTRKQLDKEFEVTLSSDIIPIDEQDTKLLDLLSWGLYQQTFENGGYDNYLRPMSNQEINDKIKLYLKEKAIQLLYIPHTSGRVSVCFEIEGPIMKLYSISRAALKHFPSATVMLSTPQQKCIIIARAPERDVYDLMTDLPTKMQDSNISLKSYRASAYAGYVHNLYQRLRTPEGIWDDDISGLLDQITN